MQPRAVTPGSCSQVKNTWGDAFYFVFSQCEDAGEFEALAFAAFHPSLFRFFSPWRLRVNVCTGYFALLLSDLVTRVPWEQLGLPDDLSIRVSLHAAPLYAIMDPGKTPQALQHDATITQLFQ